MTTNTKQKTKKKNRKRTLKLKRWVKIEFQRLPDITFYLNAFSKTKTYCKFSQVEKFIDPNCLSINFSSEKSKTALSLVILDYLYGKGGVLIPWMLHKEFNNRFFSFPEKLSKNLESLVIKLKLKDFNEVLENNSVYDATFELEFNGSENGKTVTVTKEFSSYVIETNARRLHPQAPACTTAIESVVAEYYWNGGRFFGDDETEMYVNNYNLRSIRTIKKTPVKIE